ncbi:hypothetical protein ACLK2E_14040 [Escherichia coli]
MIYPVVSGGLSRMNQKADELDGLPYGGPFVRRIMIMTEAMKITLTAQPADARWGEKHLTALITTASPCI